MNGMEKKLELRSQWSFRKRGWKIMEKSHVGCGGWRTFGDGRVFETKGECDLHLYRIQADEYIFDPSAERPATYVIENEQYGQPQ
jgi:hypothetical protein